MSGKKLTVRERLVRLTAIDDVDEMLLEGMSARDVAKFIQLGLAELTDVKEQTLVNELGKYNKTLEGRLSPSQKEAFAEMVPENIFGCRRPGVMARDQYRTQRQGIDRMIELESLYLAQRDRVDALMLQEQTEGELCAVTDRAVVAAAKLLEQHCREEQQLLDRAQGGPAHEKLEIHGYSEETAEVLAKPDSRRRVISIVERLRRVRGSRQIPELPEAAGE